MEDKLIQYHRENTSNQVHNTNNLYLLNGHISNSAVSRYAIQIGEIVNLQSHLLTLSLTSKMSEQCAGKTIQKLRLPAVIHPLEKPFLALEYLVNKTLSPRALQQYFEKNVSNSNTENNIIHYTDITLPPIIKKFISTVTVHDLIYLKKYYIPTTIQEKRFSKVFSKYVEQYKKFKSIITVSESTKSQMVEEGFEGNISVIYPPIKKNFVCLSAETRDSVRLKLGLPLDKKLILSVSSNDRRKNLSVVEETVTHLGNDFKLVRVGSPCKDSINFERVDNNTLNLIYNACDVMLFPSLSEGFGSPLVESMATGLPIVASDIEVVREVIGEAGIIVEPTVDACVKGVKDALENNSFLIESGLSRSKKFSLASFANEMNAYYRNLMKRGE